MGCCFQYKTPKSGVETVPGCQFPDETEFFDVDGKSYCRFHLRMTDEFDQPTAKAAWTLDDHKRFFRRLIQQAFNAIRDSRKIIFSGIVFPIGFKPAIVFGVHKHIPRIDFDRCVFFRKAKFSGAVFAEHALFLDAVFEGTAGFHSSVFNDQSSFEGATFRKRADFEFASFVESAKFEKSEFEDIARFESASFGSWTFFTKARFRSGTNFDYTAFNNGVFFDSTEFHGWTSFQVRTKQNRQWNVQRSFAADDDDNNRQDRNFPQINFKGAVFKARIDFSNRHFLEAADFSEVAFEIAPEFHNCVLHQDTDFSGTQFKDTKSKHAARAYRTLKLAMGDVRARNEEAMFYAKEQDSLRRRKDTPRSIKIMSWVYMALSDYGRSYIRPLFILAIMTACFSFSYWLWEVWLGGPGDPGGAFGFTMKQIVRPFFIWTANGIAQSEPTAIVTHCTLELRLIATVQSLASFGLVMLFLLALRRQFRLH